MKARYAALLCLISLSTLAFPAVTISPTLFSGGTQQLTATSGNTGGVTWSTTAGTVTSTGALTALFTAPVVVTTTKVTVTATGTGSQNRATVTITVIPLPSVLTSVAITPATATTYVGSTQQFIVTAYDQYGNIFSGVAFSWLSSDPTIATVSTTGLATGIAAGSVKITATTGSFVATATLQVNAVTLTSIALTPATATVQVNGTQTLVATGTYNNGTKAVLTNSSLTWASSNPAYITVANGVATGVAVGSSNITASLSGIISSASVISVPAPFALTTITVAPATASILVNGTQQFTATALDQYGKPITGTVFAFSSSNASVATIDIASGLATGIAAGTANITASSGSITSNAAVLTVKAVSPVTLTRLSPNFGMVGMNGDFKSLTIVGTNFATGATVNFGATVLTPSAITPTRITVTIPVAQFSAAQTVAVGVTNPGLAPSSTLPFNIVNKGFISINFDDGYASAYKNGIPILDAAGIKCTFFTITQDVGSSSDYVIQANLQTLYNNGHEIGNHTRTHPYLGQISQTQLVSETSGAEQDLTGWGYNPVSFAYPYDDWGGSSNSPVVQAVKAAGVRGARNSDNWGFNTTTSPPLLLLSYPIEPDLNNDNMTSIEADINLAVNNKAWVILLFHRVDETGDPISVPHTLIQSTINYLVQNQISVATVGEGLVIENLNAQQ